MVLCSGPAGRLTYHPGARGLNIGGRSCQSTPAPYGPHMLEFAATVFVTFLVIIDPVGTLPLFVALTHRQSRDQRRRTAIRSIVVAAVTLAVFAVAGQLLLRLLGITLPAFRIAGGILLLLLSIDMVFARKSGIRWTTAAETEEAEESIDVAVFPLAIPLIAGPGALTSVILLMLSEKGAP